MAAATEATPQAAVFSLQLFALDVAPRPPPLRIMSSSSGSSNAAPSRRLTLAFTFLDYPTVLLHATEPPQQEPYRRSTHQALSFRSGKHCVIQTEDASELVHLARNVCPGCICSDACMAGLGLHAGMLACGCC